MQERTYNNNHRTKRAHRGGGKAENLVIIFQNSTHDLALTHSGLEGGGKNRHIFFDEERDISLAMITYACFVQTNEQALIKKSRKYGIFIHIPTHTHTHTRTHAYIYVYIYIHAHILTYT